MCAEDIVDTVDECISDLHKIHIFIRHTVEINNLIIIPLFGHVISHLVNKFNKIHALSTPQMILHA